MPFVFQTVLDEQRRIVTYLNDLQAQVDELTTLQGTTQARLDALLDKKELVNRVSQRVSRDTDTVSEIVEATLEEIYEALKRGERVSLRNFGTFYVRSQRDAWVFKFRPSQKPRKFFGWSSSYKGEL